MNSLTHTTPHENCRGCEMMELARQDMNRAPIRAVNEKSLETPSSDIRVAELRSLLEEVLTSKTIQPHFSPHAIAFYLNDDLRSRIVKAIQ